MRPAILSLAVVLGLLLGGCGFELRGSNVLPEGMQRLHVTGPADLRDEIAVYLQGSETTLVEDRSTADVLLVLSDSDFQRRVLSVDPNTGKEREFELAYSLKMDARRADGTPLVENQTVTLVRDYVFDRTTLIGSGREEVAIRLEMRRDAAQQVLRRLRVAAANRAP